MDMANDGFDVLAAYRAVAGIDAAPEDFMKMALDAIQTFLRQAEYGIAAGERPVKARALSSAGKLVEFMLGLSGSGKGPLSECLARVYRYILMAILRANAADDVEALAAARNAVERLTMAWWRAFPDMDLSQPEGAG
jgi:flagellar biosynthetic protein FliS